MVYACVLYLADSGYGPEAGPCEHGTELSGFHKIQGVHWPGGPVSSYEKSFAP
jgi:hypothetical protein